MQAAAGREEAAASGDPIVHDGAARRAVDLVAGIAALVALSPFLALVALAIKLDSPGPVLYSQERMGREGRPFRILKFRSMVADAERRGPAVSGKGDPRITRMGRWLRASKVDELPQLINLVRGEVTLFGPRAEVARYLPHYTAEERRLLEVRPGLTGPGQLYFTTHQAAELDSAEDPENHYIEHQLHPKLAMDLDYLRNRGVVRDLALLGRTVAVMAGWRRG
jgi:lipopolysaccharide/colanic/teichoic acid biosynthesis glycosyltransferase